MKAGRKKCSLWEIDWVNFFYIYIYSWMCWKIEYKGYVIWQYNNYNGIFDINQNGFCMQHFCEWLPVKTHKHAHFWKIIQDYAWSLDLRSYTVKMASECMQRQPCGYGDHNTVATCGPIIIDCTRSAVKA